MTLLEQVAGVRANTFARAVGVLVGGTAVAQAIMALTLPLITRLYTPSDFSVLAVFTGLVAMVSVAACLRFDVAVPIPRSDHDAANVLALALLCCSGVSVALAACSLLAPNWVVSALKQPELQPLLWFVPIGVFLAGSYSALQFWFVRKKAFGSIAKTRIAQSSATAATQISFGWQDASPAGLVLGQTLNNGIGCIGLASRIVLHDRAALRTINWPRIRAMFRIYDRFPKYSALEALCNSASMQVPIIMIAALAVGPEAGYLLLAMYAMQAPMGLIGSAVAQVYLSRAPDEHRAGHLGEFTASVIGGLVKAGTGPLLFAAIVSPDLFAIVFGQDWRRAGVLVAWMTPWFIMQFLSAPVSMALHVTGHQRAALALQVFALLIRVVAVYAASLFAVDRISEAYALSGFVFYLTYLAVVLRVVEARSSDVALSARRGLPVVMIWVAAGAMVVLAIHALRHMFG